MAALAQQTRQPGAQGVQARTPFAGRACIVDTRAATDRMIACISSGNTEGMLEAITDGADTRWRGKQNWDMLMLAIGYRQEDVALAIIERHGQLSVCLNNLDTTGRTTLRMAVQVGMTKVADVLRAKGAEEKPAVRI